MQYLGTLIHGIAATEHLDSSGERISIRGIDISSLDKDGTFNYEHEAKQPSQTVGKILKAKKIFDESNCENEHQLYFWNKIKVPFIYVMGELFDKVGHLGAREVSSILDYDKKARELNRPGKNVINFSIEGAKLNAQGQEITDSIARKVTITVAACNKAAIAEKLEMLEDKSDSSSIAKSESSVELLSKSAKILKMPKAKKLPWWADSQEDVDASKAKNKLIDKQKRDSSPFLKPVQSKPQQGEPQQGPFTLKGPSKLFDPDLSSKDKYKKSEIENKRNWTEKYPNYDSELLKAAKKGKSAPIKFDPNEHVGKKVFVYFNLHHNLWSIRHNGKVIGHSHAVVLSDPQLKVSEPGRQRVIAEKRKNVHAGVYGTVAAEQPSEHSENTTKVSYNPYKAGHFYEKETGNPVSHGAKAHMHVKETPTENGVARIPHVFIEGAQNKIQKALTAGSGMTAPSHKTQGEALSSEDLDTHMSKIYKFEDYLRVIENRYPNMTKDESKALALFMSIKSLAKAEEKLESLYKNLDLEKSKNVREQKKRIFGTDANAPRLSEKRMKMMQQARAFAEKKFGMPLEIAQGKRDESGQMREDKDNQPAYDVFSPEGQKKEKRLLERYKKQGKKRVDPKPDWRSGRLETQPSPDAAVHELAHLYLAPEGMTAGAFQAYMDQQWGESQKKYGHLQQKKTSGEIQPMSVENPIRRELGLPANRATKPVRQQERALDYGGHRFVEGKDPKGKKVFYDRQSRLQTPETRERVEQVREGSLKFHPQKGWYRDTGPDTLINLRSKGKADEARARAQERYADQVQPAVPKKLAASEMMKARFEEGKTPDQKASIRAQRHGKNRQAFAVGWKPKDAEDRRYLSDVQSGARAGQKGDRVYSDEPQASKTLRGVRTRPGSVKSGGHHDVMVGLSRVKPKLPK